MSGIDRCANLCSETAKCSQFTFYASKGGCALWKEGIECAVAKFKATTKKTVTTYKMTTPVKADSPKAEGKPKFMEEGKCSKGSGKAFGFFVKVSKEEECTN